MGTATDASIPLDAADSSGVYFRHVIYCVIPPELEDELLPRMVEYYRDNPNVEVIVDRRAREGDRRAGQGGGTDERRIVRDRRRPRAMGTFPRAEAFDPDV